ncbi:MAG: hypothetical protein EXR52_05240 [Dehalococcoidia bacterium]|nr:hypothetical protein [Dehalococcoidia bacterium]
MGRTTVALALLRACAYALAGAVVVVGMSMGVVLVEEPQRKGSVIVLAVAGVWLLSRGGAIFFKLLFGVPL